MTRVTELYLLGADLRAFRRRIEWLEKRIAERDANAPGTGYDRAELKAFKRLLSQVEEKGQSCDAPPAREFDASRLRRAGWNIKYIGHSNPKPWTATRPALADADGPTPWFIEAATFNELEALAVAKDDIDAEERKADDDYFKFGSRYPGQ